MSCREERGVKVRLEIGPRDAEQGTCTVARSQPQPGKVAYKQAGSVDKTLAAQVADMLAISDAEVPPGDDAKYTVDKQSAAVKSKPEDAATFKQHSVHHAPSHAQNALDAGGDDLTDDFEDVEVEDDFAALTQEDLSAKKRKGDRAKRKAKRHKHAVRCLCALMLFVAPC